jgi:aspartate/methionine/tyrosine aminotransferase
MKENSFVDLRVGNTDLLKEILGYSLAQLDFFQNEMLSGMDYNKEGPLERVKETIKEVHDRYHPGLLNTNSKIVVGSGASQLISCFFHLNKKSHALSPYWFRIPVLAELHNSKIEYKENLKDIKSTKLITYPNNPDGSLFISQDKDDWYDSVYLWPWYFENKVSYEQAVFDLVNTTKKVVMFSLSKMTGHCGTRFGWAIVNDEDTYREICNYMEYESGGLGFDTQMKASKILDNMTYDYGWIRPLEEVGVVLANRKKQLKNICKKRDWNYNCSAGMFAWISTNNDNIFYELQDMGVLTTAGSKCGGFGSQVRLNLAVDSKTWDNFLLTMD